MSGKTKKKVIGATLQLDGERQFRAAVANINTDMRELSSEMRKATAQFDGNANSMEALRQRADILERQYQSMSDKIGVYRQAVAQAEDQERSAAARVEALRQEYLQAESVLQTLKASTDATTDEIQDQQAEVDELATRLQRAQQEYTAADNTLDKWRTSLNHAEADLANLSKDIDTNNKYMREAEESADGTAKSIDGYGKAVQEAEDDTSVFGDVLKANLASSVIERATGMLTDLAGSVKDYALELDDASSRVQASTGATTAEMEKYRDVMEEVYASGAGDSLDDVADAMIQIRQQMGQMDSSQMKELIEDAIALKDTFGWDYQESIRTVNALISNFGITAEQAFNLLVQGAQRGLDKNGDLLDTINEYSVHYSQMGLSAEEFFNSLVNGTEAGTFSVDKLGDAYKEFGIRVRDTADSTTEGFELIGKDADEMRAKFAAGGETARSAMEETMEALFSVDDAVKRNQAGVDLFGTMWEDLGETGVRALMDVEGNLSMTKNSMEELNEVRYDNAQARIEALGRRFTTEVAEPLIDNILPELESGMDFLAEHADVVAAGITGIATALGAVSLAAKVLGKAGTVGLAISALAGLLTGFTALNALTKENKTEFQEFTDQLDASRDTLEAVGSGLEEIKASLDDTSEGYKDQIQYAQNLGDRYFQLAGKTQRTTAEQLEMENAVSELCNIIPELSGYVDETTGLLNIQEDEFGRLTDAALDYYMAQAEAEYAAEMAKELAAEQRNLADAQTLLAESQAEYNRLSERAAELENELINNWELSGDEQRALQTELTETQSQIGILTTKMEEQQTAIGSATETVSAMEEEYKALGQTAEESGTGVDGMTESVGAAKTMLIEFNGESKTVTQEAGEAFQELVAKYDEVHQAAEESIRGQMGLFDEWSESSDVTKETLIANLDSQAAGLAAYRDNFASVTDRITAKGMEGSQEFVQALADAGIGASAELAALNTMTDEELAAYVQKWYDTNYRVAGDVASTHAEIVTEAGGTYDDILSIADQKRLVLATAARLAGTDFVEALADGTRQRIYSINNAMGDVVSVCNIAGELSGLGDNAGGSFTTAMARKIRSTVGAVTSAVGSVISSVANRIDAHSPSRVFTQLGDWSGEGYEIGAVRSLEQARLSIDRSMAGIIADVGAAASQMNLSAHVGAAVTTRRTGVGGAAVGTAAAGTVYQTVNINQPVKSSAEMARELKRAGRELAYGSG